MVNIIDDDLWNPEPALRPEDEIILRKLHEMLQSTADDLKLLSGELSKFHEPSVQIKTAPTPLDEEFNEKVHIQEIVNAKFYGHKIIDKTPHAEPAVFRGVTAKSKPVLNVQRPKVNNTGVQVNVAPTLQTKLVNRNLGISRTKIIQISDKRQDNKNSKNLNNCKVFNNAPAVAYNEFCYKYVEPIVKENSRKVLQVQEMPSINIRSELKEQKVLNIDILPECTKSKPTHSCINNVSVVTIQHETEPKHVPVTTKSVQYEQPNFNKPVRKLYKMSTCDSSGSTNNVSSEVPVVQVRRSSKTPRQANYQKKITGNNKEVQTKSHINLEEWKRKLNKVYGPSSSRKNAGTSKPKNSKRTHSGIVTLNPTKLNNAEYIPYSQLTLGGVRVSDIEKEISEIRNKNDISLSPVLDRILNSQENSPRKYKPKDSPRLLTTSDENLLQEVLDIEKTISETITQNFSKKSDGESQKIHDLSELCDDEKNESYLDDFEDDKSEQSRKFEKSSKRNGSLSDISKNSESIEDSNSPGEDNFEKPGTSKIQNTTFTKISNLSFKDSVDIFEYVHSVDRQDTGTQSSTESRIQPKETQTSPRNENFNIQPIHNDLWSPIDPSGEVKNMFKLEKEMIKKLIIDEYGDLLEKNLTKPSTSKDSTRESDKNIAAYQKNTQTSPARVKNVMTSPKKMKTRTTSPFNVTVDHHTSPMIPVTEDRGVSVNIEDEDLDISINLSSPRFSLRLPQTSRDVLSRLGSCSKIQSKNITKSKIFMKSSTQSSTSLDADNSSSEISSLGEIKLRLNRRLKVKRVPTVSESSSTSTVSLYSSDIFSSGILPLRSLGEISGEPAVMKETKSDGETSFDLLNK
ncbi:hypothetical protein O3G_MSEX008588 [Manduca sexta]|uniref:Uncharacterized protein n=1 Tax=Manduca sexta TaxID=7130 RepID=A0A921ZC86_MANSE|nr:hypothetical protein O3G_MSEX008588 [Manduca sexta]